LRSNTKISHDIILVVDGSDIIDSGLVHQRSMEWDIDEVRFRRRKRNCASGDGANNGHFHLLTDKTKYLLTIEGDVAVFLENTDFDILNAYKELFTRHKELVLATKINDYKCWIWKMEKVAKDIEKGVWSVNRVSSHFLVYNMENYRKKFNFKNFSNQIFYDDGSNFYNYEDFLSKEFAYPNSYGIAYTDSFPFQVFHCDEKITSDSVYYKRDLETRNSVFEKRLNQFKI